MEHAKLVCVGNGIYFEIWDRFMFPTFLRCGLVHVDPSAHFVGPPLLDTPYWLHGACASRVGRVNPVHLPRGGALCGMCDLGNLPSVPVAAAFAQPCGCCGPSAAQPFSDISFFMMQVPCICWIDTVVTCCLLACAAMDPRESCRYTSTNRCTACPSTKGVSVDLCCWSFLLRLDFNVLFD